LKKIEDSIVSTSDKFDEYLPLTGGVLTTASDPSDIFDSPYIDLDVASLNAPCVEIRAAGYGSVNSTWIRETGINIGDYITDGPGYHMFTTLGKQGLHFYNMYGMPGSASFTRSGITIDGKTTSDLLHAAGGTTTLKTINGESLLGSGDITTPAPTVNAASGTKTIWTGTQSEYEAVASKDANTLYFITEG